MLCRCNTLLATLGRRVSQTANLMVGVPDYDAYVAHRRASHPDQPVLSREAFFRDRLERRYGAGPDRVMRCC